MLGVSRITVRHALRNLEAAGVLRREHGRGTFVRTPRLVAGTREPHQLQRGDGRARAGRSAPGVLDVRRVRGGRAGGGGARDAGRHARRAHSAPALRRQPPDRHPDRAPAPRSCRRPRARPTSARVRCTQLLRDRYGIRPAGAEEVYRVAGATSRDAALLGLDPGDAVFVVERITSDERGPFEFTMSTMRGDRYEIRSTLRAT